MLTPKLVVDLLKQELEARSPQLAATLKQRLNIRLQEQHLGLLDERQLGFKKFQDFLDSQLDWLEITRPTGSGDITVALRNVTGAQPTSAPIRSDVWQAFTNPDKGRKRFFRLKDRAIHHFVAGENSTPARQIAESPQEYIEITPIEGSQQQNWMTDFLATLAVSAPEIATYEAMVKQPYSSAVNVFFTRALGEHAQSWREIRTKRVTESIDNWAATNNVSLEALRSSERPSSAPVPAEPSALTPKTNTASARQQLTKLVELVSDDDINQVILPLVLSTILIRSKT
jgi:hypothetical protein